MAGTSDEAGETENSAVDVGGSASVESTAQSSL